MYVNPPPIHSPIHLLSRKKKKNRIEGRVKIKYIFSTPNYWCTCAAFFLRRSFVAMLTRRTIAN